MRPRRAISGIGQLGKVSTIFTAIVPPLGEMSGVVGRPQLLVAAPGHGHLKSGSPASQPGLEPFDLPVGEPFGAGAEDVADLVERVVFAAAVTELFLLDLAADLLHRGEAELDHVECVEYGGRGGCQIVCVSDPEGRVST